MARRSQARVLQLLCEGACNPQFDQLRDATAKYNPETYANGELVAEAVRLQRYTPHVAVNGVEAICKTCYTRRRWIS